MLIWNAEFMRKRGAKASGNKWIGITIYMPVKLSKTQTISFGGITTGEGYRRPGSQQHSCVPSESQQPVLRSRHGENQVSVTLVIVFLFFSC